MKKTLKTKLSFKKDVIQELSKKEQMLVQGGEAFASVSITTTTPSNCTSCGPTKTGKQTCA